MNFPLLQSDSKHWVVWAAEKHCKKIWRTTKKEKQKRSIMSVSIKSYCTHCYPRFLASFSIYASLAQLTHVMWCDVVWFWLHNCPLFCLIIGYTDQSIDRCKNVQKFMHLNLYFGLSVQKYDSVTALMVHQIKWVFSTTTKKQKTWLGATSVLLKKKTIKTKLKINHLNEKLLRKMKGQKFSSNTHRIKMTRIIIQEANWS